MAGNQLGKTLAGSMEWAMHLTGRYPDWWQGKRFDRAVRLWAAGETRSSTRDTVQKLLLGPPEIEEEWGTGAIPGGAIKWSAIRRAAGVANAIDSLIVKHVSGHVSTLLFKAYEQGRSAWQGETLDGVWFDEEPPMDVYFEGLTRTNATGGIVMVTFTPLKGMSEVVRTFLSDDAMEGLSAARVRLIAKSAQARIGRRTPLHPCADHSRVAQGTTRAKVDGAAGNSGAAALCLRQEHGRRYRGPHRLAVPGFDPDHPACGDNNRARPDRARGRRPDGFHRGVLGIADADARSGHDGRRPGLELPPRHAAGDARRHLHRVGADRRDQHRPRGQAGPAPQGALAGAREGSHDHLQLVGDDLRRDLRTGARQREPVAARISSS